MKFKIWGETLIEQNTIDQMTEVCESLPNLVDAAMMPDSHVGKGINIGAVLALDNAVSPNAVGVDIACRMKLTAYNVSEDYINDNRDKLKSILARETVFGVGCERDNKANHPVMDEDWDQIPTLKANKDRAWRQLGTSGSGNHFVEFGVLKINGNNLLAVMSHSGSRGTGASVCAEYADIALGRCPNEPLPWLEMSSSEGQEYWIAMNMMGKYAQANHDVIHDLITKSLGLDVVHTVENHHNFCWKETHKGKEVYVHRKGATPAHDGTYGIIPGSMASPAYVVIGKGNVESICSASHGAGRLMSRTQAKKKYNWGAVKNDLLKKGVEVLSAGADEVPYVYKDIKVVMQHQLDLVGIIGEFHPRIVKMAKSGKAED